MADTQAPTPPFLLSRLLPHEHDGLVPLEYKTFTDQSTRDTYMGPDTPTHHAQLADKYRAIAAADPNDYWIKVVDTTTADNRVIAASNWKVCPGKVPDRWLEHHPPDWPEYEWLRSEGQGRREKAIAKIQKNLEMRKRLYTEPYVQLNICFSDPDYQRRGAGALMLQWGCELADHLELPMWVEASVKGAFLYKAFGFVVQEDEGTSEMGGTLLRREARVLGRRGGKVAVPLTDDPKTISS